MLGSSKGKDLQFILDFSTHSQILEFFLRLRRKEKVEGNVAAGVLHLPKGQRIALVPHHGALPQMKSASATSAWSLGATRDSPPLCPRPKADFFPARQPYLILLANVTATSL